MEILNASRSVFKNKNTGFVNSAQKSLSFFPIKLCLCMKQWKAWMNEVIWVTLVIWDFVQVMRVWDAPTRWREWFSWCDEHPPRSFGKCPSRSLWAGAPQYNTRSGRGPRCTWAVRWNTWNPRYTGFSSHRHYCMNPQAAHWESKINRNIHKLKYW